MHRPNRREPLRSHDRGECKTEIDSTGGIEMNDTMQTLPAPKLKAPPGACDCHMHIFEPRFPPRADTPYPPPVATVADYRRIVQKRLGLSRAVVIQSVTHGTDNSNLVAALETFGSDEARGVAVVDINVEDAELSRLA